MKFQNPSEDEIRTFLSRIRTIAVVGLSPRTTRPSHRVARSLQGYGYRIFPVRPAVEEVLGERAYASLRALPEKPDLVDVFRAPEYVAAIVDDCIALGLPAIWLQLGVVDDEAALRARAAGMFVVMDRCVYRDYAGFFGDTPLRSLSG
jgi:predicted CoA-binding protein